MEPMCFFLLEETYSACFAWTFRAFSFFSRVEVRRFLGEFGQVSSFFHSEGAKDDEEFQDDDILRCCSWHGLQARPCAVPHGE